MRLLNIGLKLASLSAALTLAVPALVQAAPQWSGIKGRAVLEQFILAPPQTNVVAVPTLPGGLSSSNYVPVRSPIKTAIRIYESKSGRPVLTVNTDDSGRFVALLKPGVYRIEPRAIWDGWVLGPGRGITMDMNHVIQTAPIQTVRVSGFRYADVTVVYHTVWPRIRQLPGRPIRLDPGTGPVGNVPPPQPAVRIVNDSVSLLTGRTSPPLPPTPFTPLDSPISVPQTPPPIPQR